MSFEQLPLFPLNTVLFPEMPLALHIFEERYKLMINTCVSEGSAFGVVLIKQGKEAGGSAEPYAIGCKASITQLQPLRDGRMNLVAMGQSRFKIHSLSHDKPYLVGEVEDLPFDDSLEKEDKINAWYLRKIIKNYLDVLSNVGNIEVDVQKLPREPLGLAYMAASILQAPIEHKQAFLECESASKLIKDLYKATRNEISILRSMLNPAISPQQDGPFSLN